jgi:mono/diheme cytochrome c family protein
LDKAKKGFAEPVPALKSRTASLRVRSSKTENERVAGNAANTPKGRIRTGETLFKIFCIGCHGPEGKGLPSIAPTLHSDWVTGDREILVKVLLKGLGGEIKVNGELQNFEAAMPGFGPALGDDEIASILSYVRSTWTDAKADVTSGFVKKIRSTEKEKTEPYDASALWQN